MAAIESVTAAGLAHAGPGRHLHHREVGDAILAALGEPERQAQPVPAR